MGEARRVAVPIGRGDRAEASRPLVSDDPAAETAIRRVEVDKGDHTTTGRGVADCQERSEDAPLLAVEALHHVLPVPLAHDGPARVGREGEGVAPVHDCGKDAPEGGRARSSTVGSDVGWHAHWLECRRRLGETHQVDETRAVAGRAEEADRVTVGGPLELTDLDSHPDRTEPGRLPGEPDPPRWAGSSGPDDQRSLGWEHVGDVARAADGELSHAWTAQGLGRTGEGGFQEVAIAGPHDEPLAACVEADDHRLAQRPPRSVPDTRPERHRVFGVRPETLTIKDWVKALQADPEPERIAGKPVRVVGFVYRDSRLPADWFLVARFVVQCCAVDAQPIGIPVRLTGMEIPRAGAWVVVAGAWEVATAHGERRAVIVPTAVTPTDRPEQPYLY